MRSRINMSKFQDCERNSSPMILAKVIKWHTHKIREYFHLRFDTRLHLITHTNKTVEPWYNANSEKSGVFSL